MRRILLLFALLFLSVLRVSAQYCIPVSTNGCNTGDHVVNVNVAGINNASGACLTASYSDYTSSVPAGSAMQGQSIPVEVQVADGGSEHAGMWIDYDHSGTFDASEFTDLNTASIEGNPNWVFDGYVNIPYSALTGPTTLRVRSRYNIVIGAASACTNYLFGETEDYTINITAAPSCSGTPTAGVAAGPASICTGSPVHLSLTGATVAQGITIQWESAAAGSGSFAPITGATIPYYTVTGQTVDKDYRASVSCNGGAPSISNVVTVLSLFTDCYCSPLTGVTLHSTSANYINKVSIQGTTLNSSNTTTNTDGYTQLSPTLASNTATLTQGVSYEMINNMTAYGLTSEAWIDYNHNGSFDPSEFISLDPATGSLNKSIGLFTVPLTAMAGQTGLRVRASNNSFGSNDACYDPNDGETEDYIITINAPGTCSGTPNGGYADAPLAVCISSPFVLGSTGVSGGPGISMQWEESPVGGPANWTDVPGATTNYFEDPGIVSTTKYRLRVTCAGGGTAYSNSTTVNLDSFYNCYCTNGINGGNNASIDQVAIAGTTLNNSSPGTAPGAYTLYPPAGSTTATLELGSSYTLSASFGGAAAAAFWVDYNRNGVFETAEYTSLPSGTTSSAGFTVPAGALQGMTGLRIRTRQTGSPVNANSACSSFTTGETEDYVVNISQVVCSGTPTAGTASGPASICAGQGVNLSLTGNSTIVGTTIQWQSTPSGTGNWAAISGATDPNYLVTGQSVNTDYRALVTCTYSTLSDVSNIVTVNNNPFTTCYCVSNLGGSVNSSINNITITGTTLNNSSPGAAATFYTAYPATGSATATLIKGQTYSMNYTFSAGSIASAWIDYDHSGSFDPSEWVQLTTTAASGSTNIAIPFSALQGLTGMRIRTRGVGAVNTAYDPCTTFGSGETEDYLITIDAGPACAGVPTGGTVSGPASTCPGVPFSLSVNGFTLGSGIGLQWQSSPAGAGTFTDIPGATAGTYTGTQSAATDYQVVVTCSNTPASATSNIINLPMSNFIVCYCMPTYAVGGNQNRISNVTLGNLNNSSTGNAAPHYKDYTLQQPATLPIPDLYPSIPATVFVTTANDPDQYNGVWMDFDHNGVFDANEFFTSGSNAGANSTAAITISIPLTAQLGLTRMRVRAGDDSAMTAQQACGASNSGSGEAEDYLVNILAAPSCLPVGGLTASNLSPYTADVSWNTVTGASGYEYAVIQSSTPPASGTSTVDTSASVSGLLANTAYYLHVRTDCGGGDYSTWNSYAFHTHLINDDASGAIPVTVGASCSGNPFSNLGATQSPGEPEPSCVGGAGHQTVWYSFAAPASGAVRISNDFAGGTLDNDTRMGLFSATNPSNYNTFTFLACDDDNGIVNNGRPIIFATGLTPGSTYYVEVDGYDNASTMGTFCLEVAELNSSMLGTSGSCAPGGTVFNNAGYSGWRSLTDNGKLLANVKDQNSMFNGLTIDWTKNTGAVRYGVTNYYLDRNFKINLISGFSTAFYAQFYFTDAELAALYAADPNATLGNMNVTRQSGTICQPDFIGSAGSTMLLNQVDNGSSNGANWVTVSTPGFSNFYLMASAIALHIDVSNIGATNDGARNRVDWTTGNEQKGDYFEVERSADGHSFTKVGSLTANGRASSYSFWDQTPVPGVNYYRLKLMSASGAFSYSKVVTATVNQINGFAVDAYPNPVSDQLSVTVYGQQGNNATVSICDVTGKVIRVVDMSGTSLNINMSSMAPGMYLIKYSDSNHSQTIKVSRQ